MELREVDRRWGAASRKWVWSTWPRFVFEEDGSEREDLEPVDDVTPQHFEDEQGWWTCHPDTAVGDLAVIYRSSGKADPERFPVRGPKDLRHVVLATSPAFPLSDDPLAGRFAGQHGCNFVVVSSFEPPVGIAELKNDPAVRDWPALKAGFVRAAMPMPDGVWQRLVEGASAPPETGPRNPPVLRDPAATKRLEQELESWLEGHPEALEPLGYAVSIEGRQVYCPGHEGKIDLLCRRLDRENSYLVIELKAEEVRRDAIAQALGYVGWLRDDRRVDEVTALVIGVGAHVQVPWVLKTVQDLVRSADWDDLGLPCALREALGISGYSRSW